jgi:transcription initiation factor TFIID TATA-box-binding protein
VGAGAHCDTPGLPEREIFATIAYRYYGTIVTGGCDKPEDVQEALQNFLAVLREAGITCLDSPAVVLTKRVCSCDRGHPLDLVRITMALMDHKQVAYEPEAFPGLVCRISNPRVVFLLFSSGKIIISGGKNVDDITSGLAILREKLSIVDNKA